MWGTLKHKFVLPLLGIHVLEDPEGPQFCLVSPYMKNGTLFRWWTEANPPVSQIEERVSVHLYLPFFTSLTRTLMEDVRNCTSHGIHSF